MSDPLRNEPARPAAGEGLVDREAKTEELLVLGLDHYFTGEYEHAVHVWTRVLFVDHGHARARAYIERARSALAERQRETEELLHNGTAALERGDAQTARRLLQAAVDHGGAQDEALALLERLDRLGPALPAPHTLRPPSWRRPVQPGDAASLQRGTRAWRRRRVVPAMVLAALTAGAIYTAASWDQISALLLLGPDVPALTARTGPEERLPVPTASEIALARARLLFQRGHLRDSLQALDALQPGDVLKPDADLLRAAIQRTLLTGVDPRAVLSSRIIGRGQGAP